MVKSKKNDLPIRRTGFGPAFAVLIVYFIFEYIRPQYSVISALSYAKIPMILTLVLFYIFIKSDKKILKDRLVILTILFIVEIGVSVVYAINTYHVWRTFFGMTIILLAVILVMPTICNTREKLAKFFNIWIWIHVVVAIYSVLHSGRGPGGFLLDENDLSLALNMALPIPLYLSMSTNITASRRNIYRVVAIMLIVSVGFTMSRGGFLGLLSVFAFMWLFSEKKVKSFFKILMVFAVLAFPVYKMIPESYILEMSSITDTSDSTRLERQYFWTKGWEMFVDNPILGVGAGNYNWNIAEYQLKDPNFDPNTMLLFGGRPAHSLYFTLIPELGTVGVVIFLLILHQLFTRLRKIIRICKSNANFIDELLLAKALIVSACTFLVTGAFISVLYYPSFWYLLGFTLTMYSVICSQNISGISEECAPAK